MLVSVTAVSFAQEVKSDYDHGASVGQYKTYSSETIQTNDRLLGGRIKKVEPRPRFENATEQIAVGNWARLRSCPHCG
jgi:hypothetical protein